MSPNAPLEWFRHRLNRDLLYESICPLCFLTVATAGTEVELRTHDLNHQCLESGKPAIASLLSVRED